nr:saccharopine dehydrogenase NADP-binding domain-containing protein [Butyrivibrio sp.]
MSRLLVIGCGGVAQVAIQKCAQNSKVFTHMCLASRTVSKCEALKEKLEKQGCGVEIITDTVNADDTADVVRLIKVYKPDAVLNVALPYQDLTIMDACLECKVDYIDTANYEPEDTDDPNWLKIYEKRCKEKGFT